MKNKNILLTGLAASALTLIGCGSDSDNSVASCEASLATQTQEGDAYETVLLGTCTASEPTWAYVDLDTGALTEEDGEWDIAVKRLDVKVNESMTSALVVAQDHYYDDKGNSVESEFVNADFQLETDSFLAATSVSNEAFVSTAVETFIKTEDWYQYVHNEFGPPVFNALSDNYWIIASAEGDGAFAKMHVASIGGQPTYTATFDFYMEPVGSGKFNDSAISVDVNLVDDGQTCVDFQTESTISCDDNAWDVKVVINGYDYSVHLNGGASGAGLAKALGPVAVDDYMSGTEQGLSFAMKSDYLGNAFAGNSPWVYGADSASPTSVLPNYRVYAVNFGDDREVVKVQFTNYYNELGESGQVTMRYMSLSDNGQ